MASQAITIAKIGGLGADLALQRLSDWSAARQANDPKLWSAEQWPDKVRKDADEFAEQLRMHGFGLPVIHFVEWSDMWSMGDLFLRWLTPPGAAGPFAVHANRFEIFAYRLPDDGRLAEYLASARPQQWTETDWFVNRLREAVEAWQSLAARAALVVMRRVVDGSVLDEQVRDSLRAAPPWLS